MSVSYKTLVSYLPGMASVVNSFQSEQVQIAVFDRLISALEQRPEFNEPSPARKSTADASGEIRHELVEGESIHADVDADL